MSGADISRGTLICLTSGLVLLALTFLPWEERSVAFAGVEVISQAETAWHDLWGKVLGVATCTLVAWLALQLANVGVAIGPAGRTVTPALAGVVLFVAIIKNLVNDDPTDASYLGVLAAIGIAAGAWLRAQNGEAH